MKLPAVSTSVFIQLVNTIKTCHTITDKFKQSCQRAQLLTASNEMLRNFYSVLNTIHVVLILASKHLDTIPDTNNQTC